MLLINDKEFQFDHFPNGETYINRDALNLYMTVEYCYNITMKYESNLDIVNLELLKLALDQMVTEKANRLIITYMPYSRNDHVGENKPLFLKYIANKINALNFQEVVILEPHSDATALLVDKVTEVNITQRLVNKANVAFDAIMFPDAGAQKRYSKLFKEYPQIVGFKQRDSEGKIIGYDLMGDMPDALCGTHVAIVDDLCSYGNTFIHAAKALKTKYGVVRSARYVSLFVAHCEDSIHEGNLLTSGLINHVCTTDSLLTTTKESNKMTVVSYKEFI